MVRSGFQEVVGDKPLADTQPPAPLPGSTAGDLFYVLDGQEVVGPIPASSVQAMAANGSLKARSSVARAGQSEWAEASQFGFLSGYLPTQYPAASHSAPIYAGFWLRCAAYFIDTIILNIATLVAGFVFGVIAGLVLTAAGLDHETVKTVATIGGSVLGLVMVLVYYAAFLAGSWQATPGKRMLNMHVVRTDHRRVGWLLGIGRYFAYILSSIPLGIGFMMIGWRQDKTGLHDLICKTRVVRGKPGATAASVVDEF